MRLLGARRKGGQFVSPGESFLLQGLSRKRGVRSSHASIRRAMVEALEERTLLSGLTGNGYTPSQISTAYGYNQIHIGGALATGQGQTIAIVQVNDDPNIQGDLTAFDQQFGIAAPPSFNVVNQTAAAAPLPLAISFNRTTPRWRWSGRTRWLRGQASCWWRSIPTRDAPTNLPPGRAICGQRRGCRWWR